MSRKGIEHGSITFHPDGLPHGPHPGKTEESIGKKETKELAVTDVSLERRTVVKVAMSCEEPDFISLWVD